LNSCKYSYGLRPIEPGFTADALVEFAQQAADDIPAAGAADFDITLSVHAHDGLVLNAGGGEVIVVQLIVGDDFFECCTGHFDERHLQLPVGALWRFRIRLPDSNARRKWVQTALL